MKSLNIVETTTSIDIKDSDAILKSDEYGLFFNENTVLKQIDCEGVENSIYTKEATQKIKGLYLEGSSLIIILDDTMTNDTILVIKELSADKLREEAEQE